MKDLVHKNGLISKQWQFYDYVSTLKGIGKSFAIEKRTPESIQQTIIPTEQCNNPLNKTRTPANKNNIIRTKTIIQQTSHKNIFSKKKQHNHIKLPRNISALNSRFFENIVIPSKLDANRIIKFWTTFPSYHFWPIQIFPLMDTLTLSNLGDFL